MITRRGLGSLRAGALLLVVLVTACSAGDQRAPEGPRPRANGTVTPSPAGPSAFPWTRTYEVAPNGDDDGPGDAAHPFRTLGRALGALQPGQRLLVRGGTYREDVDLDVAPGRADAPVRVEAAPGQRPILRGLLWLTDPSWWQISGLDVTWDRENRPDQHMVKITGGENWQFTDAELWKARSYAALLVGGSPRNFLLSRLYVHDTRKTNGKNQDHLIYLNCGTGGGVVERSLLVRSPNGRAIKVGPPEEGGPPVGNIVIRYNTMVDNEGPSNIQLTGDTFNVVIERNIMVRPAEGRPAVTAFELSGGDNVVRDNIVADAAGSLERVRGLVDGGGNRELDPQLRHDDPREPYIPTDPSAEGYGRWAS